HGPLDHCEDRRHQLLGPVPRGFEPRAAGLMQVAGEVDGEFLDQGLEDRGGEARELLVEGGLSPDLDRIDENGLSISRESSSSMNTSDGGVTSLPALAVSSTAMRGSITRRPTSTMSSDFDAW